MSETRRFRLTIAGIVALGIVPAFVVRAEPPRQQRATAEFFQRLDKNRDGKLVRDELPEPIRKNFDRVDTNGDGAITPKEDEAFRNRRRMVGERRSGRPGQPRASDRIRTELDVPYADTDNPRQRLDLLLPSNPGGDQPLPVVVWIHGGAWQAGSKGSGTGRLGELVSGGNYAGVSVAYRLSSEAIWPAQIHDCKAAIRWVRAHAKRYNLDGSRIGVWGSSAGGHLVAMLGTSGGVKELEGDLGKHTDQDSRVTCVVDYFGPSDLLSMGKYPSRMDHDSADSPESRLVGGPLQETKHAARGASPISYVSKDDPPFLIAHGTEDQLVPLNQSERLDASLRKAGVDVLLVKMVGAGHGFRNEEITRRVHAFFEKHLRGKDVDISGEPIE